MQCIYNRATCGSSYHTKMILLYTHKRERVYVEISIEYKNGIRA